MKRVFTLITPITFLGVDHNTVTIISSGTHHWLEIDGIPIKYGHGYANAETVTLDNLTSREHPFDHTLVIEKGKLVFDGQTLLTVDKVRTEPNAHHCKTLINRARLMWNPTRSKDWLRLAEDCFDVETLDDNTFEYRHPFCNSCSPNVVEQHPIMG